MSSVTSDVPSVTEKLTQATTGLVLADRVELVGRQAIRASLIVVLLWIGGMKFTNYEAVAISGLVANSPVMSWAYLWISERTFSALLGIIEIGIALLIVARPWSPRATVIGAVLAVGMFLTTLSFMLTTPGVYEESAGGFPALTVVPGQFLVKDLVLLAVSIWILGDAWRAATRSSPTA